MADGNDFNPFPLYAVNDPIVFVYLFAQIFVLVKAGGRWCESRGTLVGYEGYFIFAFSSRAFAIAFLTDEVLAKV